jgi:hypothetical protein
VGCGGAATVSRFHATRASAWGARQDERDTAAALSRAYFKAHPKEVVENIFYRSDVVRRVAARMLNEGRAGRDQNRDLAVDHVAEVIGVPRETILECLAIDTLETGQ